MNQPLHPNLARIAAAYDEIVERWHKGELTDAQARGQIGALMARDDQGTIWSLDPSTGQWRYLNLSRQLVPGEPPTYGVATLTPHDLSSNTEAFNPDKRITFSPVDESLLYAPASLSGATRRMDDPVGREPLLGTPARRAAAGVVAILVALGIWWGVSRGGEDPPAPPAPTPTHSVKK